MRSSGRYDIFKLAIKNNKVFNIREIQEYVPITILTVDMELNYNTLSKRLLAPEKLTVRDIRRMAELAGMEAVDFFKLIQTELRSISHVKTEATQ